MANSSELTTFLIGSLQSNIEPLYRAVISPDMAVLGNTCIPHKIKMTKRLYLELCFMPILRYSSWKCTRSKKTP